MFVIWPLLQQQY